MKFFQRWRIDEEIDEELRSHLEHRADDLERSGLPRAEAERRARLEFGGALRVRETVHDEAAGTFVDSLIQDLRFASRMLRKSPSFTIVAVVTLALGIGANAVVFSVMNALILHPLNVPAAQSLYEINRVETGSPNHSYPDYLDLRDRQRTFDGLAAFNVAQAGLDTGDNPSRTWLYEVTGNYFDVLGIQPFLGRVFHSADERGPNSAPYIVLSHAYWHTHFHDDAGVVGRSVLVNKHPFTIVGVAPPDFHGVIVFFSPDFYVPIVNREQVEGQGELNARGKRWVFMTVGHLKAGVTLAQAVADLNSIGVYLEKNYPKDDGLTSFSLGRPSLIGDLLARPTQGFVTGLMLLAGLILLAACTNLGILFAARAADRSREMALRLALGASRLRILRQLFTEAVLISLIGGAVGLWVSVALLRALSAWQPFPRFPIHLHVIPDASVYGIALLLTLASGFLFGAVPVRQVLHTDPYQIVKSGSIGGVGQRMTIRDALLVVEIAICAVLVTSSLAAVRGLVRSLNGNFGFEPKNAMLVNTVLDMAGYRGDAVPAMQRRMIDAMETIPGVASVGLVDPVPLANGLARGSGVYFDDATDLTPAHAALTSIVFTISPDYFRAAGSVLLSGRNISWHDDKETPRVAAVNQEFARRLFGSVTNAMGRYYKLRDGTRIQVVGITEDGKYGALTENPEPAMFLPFLQSPSTGAWLVVRSPRDPQQLAAAIRGKVRDLDAGLPCFVETWSQAMDLPLFPSRVATVALGVLGMMGAMLSITGIFGMAAYSVSRRLRELGVRIALGAQRAEVLRAALGRAFKLLAFGSTAGLALGLLATRLLAFIVYQATPRDPLVLAGVVLAMLALGLLATWIPARRALSIDPLILLREE